MSKRRVVITGLGVLNAAGIGREQFWKTVSSGKTAIRRITRFDPQAFPTQVAGELVGFEPKDFIPTRLIVKTDTFIHYALAATDMAIKDASLNLEQQDRNRIGVFFGNNSGGWDISERGWYEYHQQGPLQTNPWQATAWFPTGAQGFVTIRYRLKGHSKSFVCDRASGACGVYFGFRSIQHGKNDVVLSGGTEAPISRLGMTCYIGTGDLSLAKEPTGAFKPFDRTRSGLVLGEGSTVLVLEDWEYAQRRSAPIYGEILGAATTTDTDPTSERGLIEAMHQALQSASVTATDIDLILAEGCGTRLSDQVEARAIAKVFPSEVLVTSPKSISGHLYGASTATEMGCGLLSAQTGLVPPTLDYTEPDPECPLRVVSNPQRAKISRFLVNARSREGVNVSFVVSSY